MDSAYIVYKNNLGEGGGVCSNGSDLAVYLSSEILKFNFRFNTNISFYTDEILQGENLRQARQIIYSELQNLVDNYHIDADPNGFGRSAMKISILGKERILNHFKCQIDQIIYSLDGLLTFFDTTISGGGKIEIYGLGDIDVIDWNIIWKIKSIIKTKTNCTIDEVKKQTGYLFKIENIFQENSYDFKERLNQLVKKGYVSITGNFVETTAKGQVVDVWTNFVTKKITIKDPG